ncbi:MAG: hypothetical protein EON90_12545 [Brevundimonas sp.]|nr:MAG: hypothetical protein EON90_12545 [Brevundimonas sp.]
MRTGSGRGVFLHRRAVLFVGAALPLAFGAGVVAAQAPDGEALLAAAREAYNVYDLTTARTHLEAAAALGQTQPDIAVRALSTLAEYDWKFAKDGPAARARLDQALALKPDAADVLVRRGRLALESGRPAEVAADIDRALRVATDPAERVDAYVVQGRLALGGGGDPAAAIAGLQEALRLQPGKSDAAETLVDLGVASRRWDAVLEGVLAYDFIARPDAATGILVAPVAVLTEIAARPATDLSPADTRRLAIALGQARFYPAAAELAETIPADADLSALIAYRDFLAGVDAVNADIYPEVARGRRDYDAAYDAAMAAVAAPLLTALGRPAPADETPSALLERLLPIIADRFGAEGYFGTTVGFYGFLCGHTVVDERRTIEQYGVRGEFRFISLDRMVSRDFTSWYGTTNVGGWGTESTMIQVRQAYLAAPYRQLAWVTDPRARAELMTRIAVQDADDLIRCRADPYAAPEGVAQRLRLQASDRIHARLARDNTDPEALAVAFIAEVLRLTTEATVFAHEGRHSLDQLHRADAFAAMSDDERELRAKYSEILFSEDPLYALTGSIIGARLDETTGHGRANRRFRERLVGWMEAHRAEIAGLDAGTPLIMQLDRLTAAQVTAFARGEDRF